MIDRLIDDFVEKRNWLLSKNGSIVVELKIEASQWGNLGTGRFLQICSQEVYQIHHIIVLTPSLARSFQNSGIERKKLWNG